jgi:D-3-phosphoglycerate dehydrogenase
MTDAVVDALIFDLLEWLAACDRTYEEVIDVWRTSCPKLPVWEDAKDRGFVAQENFNGREIVRITAAGSAFLQEQRASRINAPISKA